MAKTTQVNTVRGSSKMDVSLFVLLTLGLAKFLVGYGADIFAAIIATPLTRIS
jgi:hypothetical protein